MGTSKILVCFCRHGVGGLRAQGRKLSAVLAYSRSRGDGGHAHCKVWAEDVSLLGLPSRRVLRRSQTVQTVHSIRCPETSWSLLKPTSLAYTASQDCGFFAAFFVSKKVTGICCFGRSRTRSPFAGGWGPLFRAASIKILYLNWKRYRC